MNDAAPRANLIDRDAWSWWEARRLRYNLALAAAGWIAYGVTLGLNYAVGKPMWQSLQGGLGMTLFLGIGFLVLMGIANICYLLGTITESVSRPADVANFRKRTFALGFWGSLAVPFLFPLGNFAIFLASTG